MFLCMLWTFTCGGIEALNIEFITSIHISVNKGFIYLSIKLYQAGWITATPSYGAHDLVNRKLQLVPNAAAPLVIGLRRYDHITLALRDKLHWLPTKQRVEYKLTLLAYKKPPSSWTAAYLCEHCSFVSAYALHHQLRSGVT
jgi:hypothetical protein